MILSFSEFNSLYESYNPSEEEEIYSDGIDIMESLMTVISEKSSLTETEVVTFLDTVLEETGWELNDEVYESYGEWISDWAPFIDEGINEDESELVFALTNRGESMIAEGKISDTLTKKGQLLAGKVQGKNLTTAFKHGYTKDDLKGTQKLRAKLASTISKHPKTATAMGLGGAALGAAGLGYGAYRGIKALKARKAKKEAEQQYKKQ